MVVRSLNTREEKITVREAVLRGLEAMREAESKQWSVTEVAGISRYLLLDMLLEEAFKRLCIMVHPALVLVLPIYEWVVVYPHQPAIARLGVVVMHVVAAFAPFWVGVVLHMSWNIGALYYCHYTKYETSKSILIKMFWDDVEDEDWVSGLVVRWLTFRPIGRAMWYHRGLPVDDGSQEITHVRRDANPEMPRAGVTVLQDNVIIMRVANVGNEVCPICQEAAYIVGRNVVALDCGHVMHRLCFQLLLDQDGYSCPVCRAQFRRQPRRAPQEPDEQDLEAMLEAVDVGPSALRAAPEVAREAPAQVAQAMIPHAQPVVEQEQPALAGNPPVRPVVGQQLGTSSSGVILPGVAVEPPAQSAAQAVVSPIRAPLPHQLSEVNALLSHHVSNDTIPQVVQRRSGGGPDQPGDAGGRGGEPIPGNQALDNPDTRTRRVLVWRNFRIPKLKKYWIWTPWFRWGVELEGDPIMQYNFHPSSGRWYQSGWIYVSLPEVLVYRLLEHWTHRQHTEEEYLVSVTKCRELMHELDMDPVLRYHVMNYAPAVAYYLHANSLTWSISRVVRDDYIRPGRFVLGAGMLVVGVVLGMLGMRAYRRLFCVAPVRLRESRLYADIRFLLTYGI